MNTPVMCRVPFALARLNRFFCSASLDLQLKVSCVAHRRMMA